MRDHFISDLLFSLGILGKIACAVIGKVTGVLGIGIIWVVLCCIAALFVPFGATICFGILKLTGLLALNWVWGLLPLVADLICLNGLLRIYRSNS